MRRRKSRKTAEPFGPLEAILATPPASRRFAYVAADITAERRREHGAEVMRKVEEERDEQRRLYGPGYDVFTAWPWLLWGDPADYTSPNVDRPGGRDWASGRLLSPRMSTLADEGGEGIPCRLPTTAAVAEKIPPRWGGHQARLPRKRGHHDHSNRP